MALACQISNLINPLTGASIFAAGFASQWYCWRNGERVSHAFAPNNQAPFMYRPTFMDPSSEHMILNFPMSERPYCTVCHRELLDEEPESHISSDSHSGAMSAVLGMLRDANNM